MESWIRRCLSCLIILSLIATSCPDPLLFQNTVPALSLPHLFFYSSSVQEKSSVFQRAATWLRGDRALQALRRPYRVRLRQCFALMAGDAAATLAVPFVGQALYDTASRGADSPGSLQTMVAVSALLIVVEGLDPLRRYVQFRLAELSSGFVADVRTFLLKRDLTRAGLIYFHGPAFAVRNIEVPLKLPLLAAQGLLSAGLLGQRDPIIAAVACATALLLAVWSHHRSGPLARASTELRQAESETLAVLEHIAAGRTSEGELEAQHPFERLRQMEIQQIRQSIWYDGVVDRISTLVLMTGVMLWGAWHQYRFGQPSTGQILTLLALAWNVQYKISGFLTLVKRRLEAESASFLISDHERRLQESA